jgi:hypothetical protein
MTEKKEVDRAKIGKRNKRKGSNAERLYANIFKELGFEHCKTSRYGAKAIDDVGVDLINIPYNVQIKAGYAKGLNYSKVLHDMVTNIESRLMEDDPVRTRPNIIVHRKDVGAGNKRNPMDDLVVMSFETFKQLTTNG